MTHADRQIEEGTLLLDVSEFPNSDAAHYISEKIAEINQGRRVRGLPEIEYTIDEIQGDTAYLIVTEIPLGVGL
jgi:hypothetical protein